MNPRTFIINRIRELVAKFSEAKVRYVQDSFSGSHIVEILPKELYFNNSSYGKYEANCIFDFINNFPDDEIVCVTEGSVFGFDNPIYEEKGKSYNECTQDYIKIDDLDFHCEINFYEDLVEDTFPQIIFRTNLDDHQYLLKPCKEEPTLVNFDYFYAEAA